MQRSLRMLVSAFAAVCVAGMALTAFAAQSGGAVNPGMPHPAVSPCPPTIACPPTPCPPNVAGINCKPTPCPPNVPNCAPPPCQPLPSGAPNPNCKLPDLTSGREIIVGGAVGGGPLPSGVVGHHVPWGTTVNLTDKDAFLNSNGQCAFNISYVLANIAPVNAPGPFKDVIHEDLNVVSIQSALSQAASSHRSINTRAYLPGGGHTLALTINAGHAQPESNYANNHFDIKYVLVGNCSDVVAQPAR